MRLATATVVLAVATAPAFAVDCAKAVTQMDMNACAAADFQAADRRLNAVYNEIAGRLRDRDDTRRLLVASEAAWIKFRDSECMFATSEACDGSIYPMLMLHCKSGMTRDRTEQLQVYLQVQRRRFELSDAGSVALRPGRGCAPWGLS
jgi:uncharacterized protein YecT (DUF1311 family)